MRLAEEEKLRKEMSAKKAKEEAERKHQVSGGRSHASLSIRWPAAFPGPGLCSSVLRSLLRVRSGCVLAQDGGGRAVAPGCAGPCPQKLLFSLGDSTSVEARAGVRAPSMGHQPRGVTELLK